MIEVTEKRRMVKCDVRSSVLLKPNVMLLLDDTRREDIEQNLTRRNRLIGFLNTTSTHPDDLRLDLEQELSRCEVARF